ncbi:MAG: hypothetical protein DPW11_04750 [bacterium]|nr:DUF87 domain-containing protein [Anaerolineales bacterium]MCQ3945051.1 hypothetical protein [bacterium]
MKPVAVISSPNTTSTFQVDILEEYIGAPLEGMIVYFDVEEKEGTEKRKKRVVCQLFGMQGSNRWHEDPIMKAVIKKQGALQFLSGDSDTKFATLKTMGVFSLGDKVARTMLNTPPSSGTNVYVADASVIEGLVKSDKGVFYPGVIYASETPAPTYLRHFGPVDKGGNGEAMLIGTFGQSGYGKSVISATLIAGFAVNREIGLFIIDPAGEFAGDKFGRDSNLNFQFHRLLRLAGRQPIVKKVKEVALESEIPFVELLKREEFFDNLGFKGSDKEKQAKDRARNYLKEMDVDLSKMGQSPANSLDLEILTRTSRNQIGFE